MKDFYRKRSHAVSAFLKDKSFFIILFASLVMVCAAGFLAFNTKKSEPVPNNSQVENGGYDGEVPQWQEETPQESVNTPVEDVPAENPEIISVEFIKPIEVYTTVYGFSGTVPVFSETLQDWRLHTGADYFTEGEEPVYASADGIVEDIYDDGLMGMTVVLSHADGSKTVYQSLSDSVIVIKGAEILRGDRIGNTGSTADAEITGGNHVHFAVVKDGAYVNPDEIYS